MNPHLLLIFKSGYFPRVFGLLMALAGLCYLVNSFALLLAPALASALFPLVLPPAFVGELGFALWLVWRTAPAPVFLVSTTPSNTRTR